MCRRRVSSFKFFFELSFRHKALHGINPVDEEDAVEMVYLMLEYPGQKVFCLKTDRPSFYVQPLDPKIRATAGPNPFIRPAEGDPLSFFPPPPGQDCPRRAAQTLLPGADGAPFPFSPPPRFFLIYGFAPPYPVHSGR